MRKLLLLLVALPVLFGLGMMAASELGGEVVTLYTREAGGGESRTSLWVVEHEGFQYLRAGDRSSAWFERLRREPEVRVERRGKIAAYQAVPTPELTGTIDALMAEQYGLADRFIGLIRDPSQSMAVKLVPASP
jgi:hypothetical protein